MGHPHVSMVFNVGYHIKIMELAVPEQLMSRMTDQFNEESLVQQLEELIEHEENSEAICYRSALRDYVMEMFPE